MPDPYILYSKLDDPKIAYMIKSGEIRCEITGEDHFTIPVKQVIIGGGEILLSKEQGFTETRHLSLFFQLNENDDLKNIIKLKPPQIINGINTYKVAFHTARFIASCLKEINEIRTIKADQLNKNDEILKNYSIIYAQAIADLETAFQQKGFPWIEKVVEHGKNELMYQKGKSFVSMNNMKPVEVNSDKLDKYNVRYPKGSFLCKQGETGTELYKLVKGKLKVIVNGNEVTDIEEGTVVGEMALLLGETRTATLKATEDCVVTVIKKGDLPQIVKDDPDFFKNIIITLSRWELISVSLVENLCEMIHESKHNTDEQKNMKKLMDYKAIIKELRKKLNSLYTKYEQQFLFDISSEIKEAMKNIEKKH